jgi:hypothetical protein
MRHPPTGTSVCPRHGLVVSVSGREQPLGPAAGGPSVARAHALVLMHKYGPDSLGQFISVAADRPWWQATKTARSGFVRGAVFIALGLALPVRHRPGSCLVDPGFVGDLAGGWCWLPLERRRAAPP